MPTARKLRLGTGAVVEAKASSTHPSALIRSIFPNKNPNKRLTGIILRQEDKIIRKKLSSCLVFQCDLVMQDDQHLDLYANIRKFKVVTEGPLSGLFISAVVGSTINNGAAQQTQEEAERTENEFPSEMISIRDDQFIQSRTSIDSRGR